MKRMDNNPLLTPEDLRPTKDGLEIFCTLNPAAVRFGEEILLLVRVGERAPEEKGYVCYLYLDDESGELNVGRYNVNDPDLVCPDERGYYYKGRMVLSSLSHLRIARSTDGRNFKFDPQPAIFPSTPYEAYGCEDPRITYIDGRYYICYTAVSNRGVTVAMASTTDFVEFQRHGLIFPPYQKDVVIFPEKIRGRYACRHRPFMSEFNPASIWTGYSPDLHCWGYHEMTLAPAPGGWEAGRVGCGGTPIRTGEGWLEIYHAADDRGRYALGAMLSDLAYPERVLCRSAKQPIFWPEAEYERTGIYGNCVFTNGWVADEDGTLRIYYGAADRICAGVVTSVEEMIQAARNG